MKKITSIVLVALFTISTFAQRQQGEDRKQRHQRPDFTIDQIAELQTKKMVLQFDLNEKQQRQVLEINKTKAADRKQKMEARKTITEESIKTLTSDEIFKMKSEKMDKMITNKAEMKAILNSEQYDKWENTLRHRAHHVRNKKSQQKSSQKGKRK